MVSNAGTAHAAPVDRMELADWERSFAVNATGHFLVANLESAVLTGADLSLALVDPRWRPAIEGSGARNVDKVRWSNMRLNVRTA